MKWDSINSQSYRFIDTCPSSGDWTSFPGPMMLLSSVSNFPHSVSSLCSCRAATIQAETDGQLWAMDRQTFRRILLKSAFRKRKMYEALLDSVPMLKTLQVRLGFTRCSAGIGAIFDHITNGYGVIFFSFLAELRTHEPGRCSNTTNLHTGRADHQAR